LIYLREEEFEFLKSKRLEFLKKLLTNLDKCDLLIITL